MFLFLFFEPDSFTVLSGNKNASILAMEHKIYLLHFCLVRWVDFVAGVSWMEWGSEGERRFMAKERGKGKEKKKYFSHSPFFIFHRLLTSEFGSL